MSLKKLIDGEEYCLNCKLPKNGGRQVQATEYISFVMPDKDGHQTLFAGTYCKQCGDMIEEYCANHNYRCTRSIYVEENGKEKVMLS